MALRLTTLKRAAVESRRMLESRSFSYNSAISPPFDSAIDRPYRFAAACFTGVLSGSIGSFIDDKFQIQIQFPKFLFWWIHGANGCAQEEGVVGELSCYISTPAAVSGQRSIPDEHSNSNN